MMMRLCVLFLGLLLALTSASASPCLGTRFTVGPVVFSNCQVTHFQSPETLPAMPFLLSPGTFTGNVASLFSPQDYVFNPGRGDGADVLETLSYDFIAVWDIR